LIRSLMTIGDIHEERLLRSRLLLGDDGLSRLASARGIVFGVGGVGSWCAEALVRTGVRQLTIVDSDVVCPSNINRQLMATTRTVGRVKVEVLRERLLEINPEADITALQATFSEETAADFYLETYDYILDCIDSLKDKRSLILHACDTPAKFFCSLGAALKIDPVQIKVAEFWKVRGCPLGSLLRKKMKRENTLPRHKFLCVYDEEVLPNRGPEPQGEDPGLFQKAVTNGTMAHITALFGFTLCGLVIRDACQEILL
jgi:tRNA A37 threonylcarbamoyladenosine dehydratase